MDTGIKNIADLVNNLNISDKVSQNREHEPLRSIHSQIASHRDAIITLIQSTNRVIVQTGSVKSLAEDANSLVKLPLTEVCFLNQSIKELNSITSILKSAIDSLNGAVEDSVLAHLRSLGSQSPSLAFKLLSHFDKQTRAVIRKVFDTTNGQDVLWKVAEECFQQAVSRAGNLHADNYFDSRDEACQESPYDPDFESEEYNDHENRLDVDEGYTASFLEKERRRSEARRKEQEVWPKFWIGVLNKSPAGPTLFHLPASLSIHSLYLNTVPQYLFRTFDDASSGRSDDSVIASIASVTGSESSRVDILTMERQRATELLHMHLTKSCFGGEGSDNLMSWTSSLLFAVQYAFWRLRIRQCSPADIKICAVDTRKFPQGQFAQDIELLTLHRAAANRLGNAAQNFFDFRLGNDDFYNGEYLSQGAVSIKDRSCVVSLEQLIQAGLFELYPEFDDDTANERWAKRVLQLRQKWSMEQGTTDQEIELALEVARSCFTGFRLSDIASILLTFKNRRISEPNSTSEWPLSFAFAVSTICPVIDLLKKSQAFRMDSSQNGQRSQTKSVDTGLPLKQSSLKTTFLAVGSTAFFYNSISYYEKSLNRCPVAQALQLLRI